MATATQHPCFNKEAKHTHARVHLPVAPKCNIQCKYCNRKYDCVNESRPGVTSAVLNPIQSLEYIKLMKERLGEKLSVVGIAGPGDAFANPEETLESIRLIKGEFPEIMFCLSTNGVELMPYIDQIAELGVTHVTITINSLRPEVLADVYRWVRYEKKVYRGLEAGKIMADVQIKCIEELKARGIVVKINTILLPGINDEYIEELAEAVAKLGADTMNIIPIKPTKGTEFAGLEEPSEEMVKAVMDKISKYIEPMTHCSRCRADAAGLIGQDMKERHCMLKDAALNAAKKSNRERVAVASHEGMLVNQHLGEAASLFIYEKKGDEYVVVEERSTPTPGAGNDRWIELAKRISDCRAILVGGIGPKPQQVLTKSGVQIVLMSGLIDAGLEHVYEGTELRTLSKEQFSKCGDSCSGNAQGCA